MAKEHIRVTLRRYPYYVIFHPNGEVKDICLPGDLTSVLNKLTAEDVATLKARALKKSKSEY